MCVRVSTLLFDIPPGESSTALGFLVGQFVAAAGGHVSDHARASGASVHVESESRRGHQRTFRKYQRGEIARHVHGSALHSENTGHCVNF